MPMNQTERAFHDAMRKQEGRPPLTDDEAERLAQKREGPKPHEHLDENEAELARARLRDREAGR